MPIAQRQVAHQGTTSARRAKRAAAIIGAGMVMLLAQLEAAAAILGIDRRTDSLAGHPPVALVVGNSNYAHVAREPGGTRDAEAMAKSLSRLGFDVVEGLDLDREDFISRVVAFQNRSAGRRAALFYYSGHAMHGRAFDKGRVVDALLPVDIAGSGDMLSGGIDIDDVIAGMDGRVNLVILDSDMKDRPRIARLNTLIAYAGTVPLLTEQGGAFTNALLPALVPGVDVVDAVREAIRSVRRSARLGPEQLPWMESSLRHPYRLPSPARLLAGKLDARLVELIERLDAGGAEAATAYGAANDIQVMDGAVVVRLVADSEDALAELERRIGLANGEVTATFENTVYASLPVATIATLARSDLVHRVDLDAPVVAPLAQPRADAAPDASPARQDERE